MMPLLVEIEPGARLAEYGRHAGEEWVHVLDGRLRLELEGAEPRMLEPGDSAYYPAERPHLFCNDDDGSTAAVDLRRHAADDVMERARWHRDGSAFETVAAYARAVRAGALIAVSGTAAPTPTARALMPGDAYGQAREAIARAVAAVEAARWTPRGRGADAHAASSPGADWRGAAQAHGEAFAGVDPANTTLVVAGLLPEGVLVEVELDAVVDAP